MFISDIENDIALFEQLQSEIRDLDIVNNDPKRVEIFENVKAIVDDKKDNRKVIIFSEFVDTVKHLEEYFREKFGNRLLVCDGKITKQFAKHLNENFNAQHKGNQEDQFDVLITSDKLAEGFNLNRAGAVSYTHPEPTRPY